ncbi:putative ABC transporter periplasmic binding protein precursor [Pelotomaculum sp. FP]|uniref:ABC transporter substrate-binding protein n=1 Tax=Pelotomaculum sp. FP TaxID=261474 RepID=UPI001101E1F3|nr:MetQ/NlpA family ABC transporter substrate-binding protein [Pelotomaculum sp. FP]TEB15463.1 putative ABC transporter periplasmic binding protein precursor [Pelotomaculum sp. FP]
MKNAVRLRGLILLVLSLLLLAGCGQTKVTAVKTAPEKLKIGVLPLEDAMPAVVAEKNGYFAQENLDVELVRFQSAVEQESAIQSGQLDGIVNDLIVAALLKESGQNIKVTSIALGSTPEEGKFAIVAAPKSGINTLADLKGKKIGIANNTIIEYVTDGLLEDGGIDPSLVDKVSVPKIPVRVEMLFSHQVDAIVVPDPLLTFAEFKGAKIVVRDTARNLSQSVVIFNQKTLNEKKGAVKAFYRAYANAVDDLNNHPVDYQQVMIDNVNIPEQIAKDYQIQRYPKPQLPAEEDVNNILKWMTKKGLLKTDLKYQDLVEKI